MDDFAFLQKYGLITIPVGDPATTAEAEVNLVTKKVRGIIDEYDVAADVIRSNAHLTPTGKAVALRKLGLETMAERLDKLQNFINPHITYRKGLIEHRAMKPTEENPVVRAIRAMEIRQHVLRSSDPTDAVLLDAAGKGDVDVVDAIANAPVSMLSVSPDAIRVAQETLADKRDPEGAKTIKRLGDAITAFQKMIAAAIDHVSTDSGVADPDSELQRVAETGVVPRTLNRTLAGPTPR